MPGALFAAGEEPRRVLILQSFGRDFAPFSAFTSAFKMELALPSFEPIEFFEASLEVERPGGAEASEARLRADSQVRYRVPILWAHDWELSAMLAVCVGEAFLILVLLRSWRRLRRTQADLRESEQHLGLAAAAASLGLWAWNIQRDEVWITDEGRAMFGWGKTEPLNFERFINTVHPEDREVTRQAVLRSVQGRDNYRAVYRVVTAGGATRWIAARGQVEHGNDGQPRLMRGVSVDITECKQAEEKFRLVVEASPNTMIMVNAQAIVTLVNARAEAVFGYTRAELFGKNLEILVPEWFRGSHGDLSASTTSATGLERKLFGFRRDGSKFPVEVGLNTIRTTEGSFVLASIVDITQRKRDEVEIQRQRAELAHVARVSTMGELAASLAHELNQPLGAILSNADAAEMFLSADPPSLNDVRDILRDIRKDDQRAGEVIHRMRALLSKHEMEISLLDLNDIAQDILKLVSADASLRKTSLHAQLTPNMPLIRGDRVHLQQVILNLVVNGMEAMAGEPPRKRRLTIRTGWNGDSEVELAVTDTGHGIAPDKLPNVFDPFFTTKANGMGMGLSIARTIIETHGGRIWAESNGAGGATFRFALPFAPQSTATLNS
jgi:two-component system, LuxR family, sensor kinase FixL